MQHIWFKPRSFDLYPWFKPNNNFIYNVYSQEFPSTKSLIPSKIVNQACSYTRFIKKSETIRKKIIIIENKVQQPIKNRNQRKKPINKRSQRREQKTRKGKVGSKNQEKSKREAETGEA